MCGVICAGRFDAAAAVPGADADQQFEAGRGGVLPVAAACATRAVAAHRHGLAKNGVVRHSGQRTRAHMGCVNPCNILVCTVCVLLDSDKL